MDLCRSQSSDFLPLQVSGANRLPVIKTIKLDSGIEREGGEDQGRLRKASLRRWDLQDDKKPAKGNSMLGRGLG